MRSEIRSSAHLRFERLSLFLSCIVVLAVSSEAAEPKRGGALRFGVQKSVTTLNPFVQTQSLNNRVRSLVYEGLLASDRNLDVIAGLASSWSVSADGLTYTFTLRPGVKFHHGRPLTLADVKWSLDYVQDPKSSAFGQAELSVVKQVEVEEPDKIQFRLKSAFAPFLTTVAGMRLLPIVAKDSVKPGEKPDSFPPGTGPFRFVAWRPAQELRVARFEGYWQKGLPYLDDVRFVFGIDDTNRLNAVRAGDLDITEEIPMDAILRIREGKVPGVAVALAAAGNHPRMGINHCRPPFNNLKVRQAFAYALDKQEIVEGAYSGLGIPTNQKLVKGMKWFASEVPDRKQDLAKARALLAEAGYPDGLKITIPGSPGTEKVLQVIQSQVRKAGIDLTIVVRDQATHLASLNKADFEISMSGGSTNADPDLAYYGYYHTPAPDRRHLGGRTQPCYSNPRVDQLLEDARKVTDFQQRRKMYAEIISILHEEVADIPIGFISNGYALSSQVRDFEPEITSTFSYGNGGILKTWLDR
jgi:peptide/nickel transport system substrate-binding protein